MKKILGRFTVLVLLGGWAVFAVTNSDSHTHKCNEEWKLVIPSYTGTSSAYEARGQQALIHQD